MNTATVTPFIARNKPRKDGLCKVSIRVTHQGEKRYYSFNMNLKASDFDRIMTAKKRNESDKAIYNKIHSFESKAIESVEALPVFTFMKFEAIFLSNRDAGDEVATGFDNYIQELKDEKRIGTAVSYECARNSIAQYKYYLKHGIKAGIKEIKEYKSNLKYADITPAFLKKYQSWMTDDGNSMTTVGIYLRSLRTILNRANLDRSLYPFGAGKNKYSIPKGRNVKKALSQIEINKIYFYQAEAGSTKEMARDLWIFSFQCNGMNVKDICLLKHKDIDNENSILKYQRSKTKNSKNIASEIIVSLKPESKAIIKKHGIASISPDSYVFPFLNKDTSAIRERQIVQQLTKTINKYMKLIAAELEINKQVTTYFARHSFSQTLRLNNASTEFIKDALGHSDIRTTESYLDSFATETIHKNTEALTFAK